MAQPLLLSDTPCPALGSLPPIPLLPQSCCRVRRRAKEGPPTATVCWQTGSFQDPHGWPVPELGAGAPIHPLGIWAGGATPGSPGLCSGPRLQAGANGSSTGEAEEDQSKVRGGWAPRQREGPHPSHVAAVGCASGSLPHCFRQARRHNLHTAVSILSCLLRMPLLGHHREHLMHHLCIGVDSNSGTAGHSALLSAYSYSKYVYLS